MHEQVGVGAVHLVCHCHAACCLILVQVDEPHGGLISHHRLQEHRAAQDQGNM